MAQRRRNRRHNETLRARLGRVLRLAIRILRLLLIVVAVGACVTGAIVGGRAGWQALQSWERLRVAQVTTTGLERAQERDILAYSRIRSGDPILQLDLEAIAGRVRQHPWVRSVQVRRRFPDRVALAIEEHQPAILVDLGGLYVASSDGMLFKKHTTSGDDEAPLRLPVVTGLRRADVSRAPKVVVARLREALALWDAIRGSRNFAQLGAVRQLHWDTDLGWDVVTDFETVPGANVRPLRIALGHQPRDQLAVAAFTVARLRDLGRQPAVIWADSTKASERVHVQLLAENAR